MFPQRPLDLIVLLSPHDKEGGFTLKKYFQLANGSHLENCSYILLFQRFFLFSFIDTDEDTVKRCFATFEEKFFQTCEKELAKINIFYSGKVLICVYLWKIQQHKRSLKLPDFQNSHSVHEGLPSGNYRARSYGRLLWFNHRCGTKTIVFEWRKNEGQAISLLCNSILLNFEDALKFKWQLTYRAQFLSLPMVAVYCACFRLKCIAP